MVIFKEFTFEAAHKLPNVPAGHKCAQLHGHSFRVQLHLRGEVDPETGWVQDFSEIKEVFQPVLKILDHSYLNEIEGLSNPTSENIARWIWEKLSPRLPQLDKVILYETRTAGAVYP